MSKVRAERGYQYLPNGDVSRVVGVAAKVLAGKDTIVSFDGTSQFTARGVSACGLAAFNFARIGFRTEQSTRETADIVNELGSRQTIEEIVAICAGWSKDLHLEVDDLYCLPIFKRYLKLVSIEYTNPRPEKFLKLLDKLLNIEKSAVVIITRPPEIIACFKFANTSPFSNTPPKPVFVIFDSHPRPSHPKGAGLSFSTSAETTARTLGEILPAADESLLHSLDFQWQAQLLANCSGHVFVANEERGNLEDCIVRSSLSILSLRTKLTELNRQNESLTSNNKHLESEVDRLSDDMRQERQKAIQIPVSTRSASRIQQHGFSLGRYSHATPGPSRSGVNGTQNHSSHNPFRPSASDAQTSRRPDHTFNGTHTYTTARGSSSNALPSVSAKVPPPLPTRSGLRDGGARSIFADNPPPVPTSKLPTYEDEDEDLDLEMDTNRMIGMQPLEVARQIQAKYDLEDRQLRQEHADLVRKLQATFPCGICLEEQPEECLARVDDCTHTMCRDCLRDFVCSKIQEHRFPILCPICMAAGDREPATISRLLIEQLGITEEHFQILIEMELAEFTIQIHCRMCKRAAFVDRQDYSDLPNIVCPQTDCHNVWCKKCEQSIVIGGPKHSCDGSSELDHLMKEKGWKHCPNCTTPILKESGCNHMTCISPGCNTHFCYVCGGMIVRSALKNEVASATTAHYRSCQLFEVPD